MDIGSFIEPWAELLFDQVPGVELFDAHTHLGQNDPDGMKQTPQELLATLNGAHARGAFVFPMHELDGYPAANDMVIAAAADVAPVFGINVPTGAGVGAAAPVREYIPAGSIVADAAPVAE